MSALCTRVPVAAATLATLLALTACTTSGSAEKPADGDQAAAKAAQVDNPRPELDLTTVTLSAEAEERLGIRTAPLERRALPRVRRYGGEVLVPVRAPGADGTLLMPPQGATAGGGGPRSAEALVTTEEEVARARAQANAAASALRRAEQLLREDATAARTVEEARAQLETARAAQRAAESRRDLLLRSTLGRSDVLWIRVPVYAGDVSLVAADRDARVDRLGTANGMATRTARPVAAPPSANPDAATVDLYYQLTATDRPLVPGEKVAVTLDLRDADATLVVPWSAVLHDIHGGEWVYVRVRDRAYALARVQVRYVSGPDAALAFGPGVGVPIVVAGATELFGSEFGVAH